MTYSISHIYRIYTISHILILWLIYCDSYLYWKRGKRKNNSAPVRTEEKTDWVLNPESSIMRGLGMSEFQWLEQIQDWEGFWNGWFHWLPGRGKGGDIIRPEGWGDSLGVVREWMRPSRGNVKSSDERRWRPVLREDEK